MVKKVEDVEYLASMPEVLGLIPKTTHMNMHMHTHAH